MNKLAAIVPAVVVLGFVASVWAGVVIDEQQTIDQPNGTKVTRNRTVMIQDDKQISIIDNGARSIITDLGKGLMTMIDGARKSYVELPFPPRAPGMAAMQGGLFPTIHFKHTGAHETIQGYSCDDYSGEGTVGLNSVSMSGCFSTAVPGADDYSNFQRQMADKVKGTTVANLGQIPHGVPLKLKIVTTLGNLPAAGLSREEANKLNQMLTNRQFVTETTVSKISVKSLPPDSFEAPGGYQREQLPPMLGGMSHGAPATPAAPSKVPE